MSLSGSVVFQCDKCKTVTTIQGSEFDNFDITNTDEDREMGSEIFYESVVEKNVLVGQYSRSLLL